MKIEVIWTKSCMWAVPTFAGEVTSCLVDGQLHVFDRRGEKP